MSIQEGIQGKGILVEGRPELDICRVIGNKALWQVEGRVNKACVSFRGALTLSCRWWIQTAPESARQECQHGNLHFGKGPFLAFHGCYQEDSVKPGSSS